MEMLQQMSRILMEFSLTESAKPIDQLPLLQKIQEKIEKNQELLTRPKVFGHFESFVI